jgi:hypothetical protein
MFNQRKSKRIEIALPLRIKLLGASKQPPIIKTTTRNISPVGISVELPVTLAKGVFFIQQGEQSVNLIRYLIQKDKEVDLEITLPPLGENFKTGGRVIWYHLGSREGDTAYYFGAGILLKETAGEEKKRWERFTKNTVLETGKVWQHIQHMSALIFLAGIIIFIVGYYDTIPLIAKGGVFLSFMALCGFVAAWWLHRKSMHLTKHKLF